MEGLRNFLDFHCYRATYAGTLKTVTSWTLSSARNSSTTPTVLYTVSYSVDLVFSRTSHAMEEGLDLQMGTDGIGDAAALAPDQTLLFLLGAPLRGL